MAIGLFISVALAAGATISCCWRMIVGATAARPLSPRVRVAAGLNGPPSPREPVAGDFAVLERLFRAAGALATPGHGTLLIRMYYSTVSAIARVLPVLAPWSEREMLVCSRYLAVCVDRYLASNAACSHRVRLM
jgi:hypothetical protein